ncbi:hypothetical protein B0H63DRAFT_197150 [Podospora didyma]|uniref:Uncharacterized protein n=1 Tax=Podospora didyma TaxID=330526 RepID=A0AAE0NGS9_9PEZI|nr:hypothetical protein B0H63DRAFT_197150 [Podospora didyma]
MLEHSCPKTPSWKEQRGHLASRFLCQCQSSTLFRSPFPCNNVIAEDGAGVAVRPPWILGRNGCHGLNGPMIPRQAGSIFDQHAPGACCQVQGPSPGLPVPTSLMELKRHATSEMFFNSRIRIHACLAVLYPHLNSDVVVAVDVVAVDAAKGSFSSLTISRGRPFHIRPSSTWGHFLIRKSSNITPWRSLGNKGEIAARGVGLRNNRTRRNPSLNELHPVASKPQRSRAETFLTDHTTTH